MVICSWKKYPNYQKILYDSGLDESIVIAGKTEVLNASREEEIKKYLKEHIYIDKFLILDDIDLGELSKYQIKTSYPNGFDKYKYEEARKMLKENT